MFRLLPGGIRRRQIAKLCSAGLGPPPSCLEVGCRFQRRRGLAAGNLSKQAEAEADAIKAAVDATDLLTPRFR